MGIIRATGEDAVKFLQGQLTQDVASLSLSEARLAAFCNAKGRVQASFIVFKRANEDILMICAGDILAQTLKRLSMFVMRAKVKLSDASAEFALYGLTGAAADQWVPGAAPWSRQDIGPASVLRLYPGAGVSRACWCAPADALPPEGPEVPLTYWHGLSVRSGIAMVGQAGYEAFVPQMLNYESVGGVNFKKGCYPGQEVVARSQFRGTLKRRAYVVHAEQALAAGEEVFHAGDPEQPCGLVAAAAPCPDGAGFDAVVSIQTAAAADAADGRLRAASPTGPTLTLRPLPYALLEDI
jgi:folate-binding protein YgfZ